MGGGGGEKILCNRNEVSEKRGPRKTYVPGICISIRTCVYIDGGKWPRPCVGMMKGVDKKKRRKDGAGTTARGMIARIRDKVALGRLAAFSVVPLVRLPRYNCSEAFLPRVYLAALPAAGSLAHVFDAATGRPKKALFSLRTRQTHSAGFTFTRAWLLSVCCSSSISGWSAETYS